MPLVGSEDDLEKDLVLQDFSRLQEDRIEHACLFFFNVEPLGTPMFFW